MTAFLLAPWLAPLVYCVLLTFSMGVKGDGRPLAFFLISLGLGLIVGYPGTAALVVSLWLIAQVRPVTKVISVRTGIALAVIGYLPFIFIEWKSSGPNLGSPIESFATTFAAFHPRSFLLYLSCHRTHHRLLLRFSRPSQCQGNDRKKSRRRHLAS